MFYLDKHLVRVDGKIHYIIRTLYQLWACRINVNIYLFVCFYFPNFPNNFRVLYIKFSSVSFHFAI